MRKTYWGVLVTGFMLILAACGGPKDAAAPTPAELEAGRPTFLFLYDEP